LVEKKNHMNQYKNNTFQRHVSLVLSLVVVLFGLTGRAQTVTNVTAEQQGNALSIHYNLASNDPCEVSLFVSLDGGKTWTGPLLRVSGDVGEDINNGSRTIRWLVLEEMEQLVGNNIQFKVVASGKKPYEPDMVFVKGGTFMMGSNSGDDDERPLRKVSLSDFAIGKYEVTQGQWRIVMGSNSSNFSGCDQCPVEQVSWDDVQQFITTLNSKTGKKYRLPTEAEWEYAARGGSQSRGYTCSGSEDIGTVAWYSENSSSKTHPVGQKQANELGLCDMTGNVWEWCSDWYGPYSSSAGVNPSGAFSGRNRVARGGSWLSHPQYCRVADRDYYDPSGRYNLLGFRLVLVPVR
jgi:formylglycine-generating enzyme required for sulfatase activity